MLARTPLAIFHGPHAYISPTWYQSERVVPTWNYVAVHAVGSVQLIKDSMELVELVCELTRRSEASMPVPWKADPNDPYVETLATQIVGFRIEITRIEGKWKLNQNHPQERRQRVIAALRGQGGDNANEIAELMEG